MRKMTSSRLHRFFIVLVPALLVPLQLLVFGPHTVYAGNLQEFSASFGELAVHLAFAMLLVSGVLALAGVLLPVRLFPYYTVALVALGVVCWAQGNLMVGDYGPLNGQDIDFSGHAWRNRYELLAWTVVPLAAVAFAPALLSAAVFGSRVLVALQFVLVAYTIAQADPAGRAQWRGAPDAIFELSSKQNVFHFVLDGFQSDAFHDIVNAERAEMDRQFAGFTFFANHLGAFPTTVVSIPAMLTGAVYRNDEPMPQFLAKHFERASLFGAMKAQGYQVDAVSGLIYDITSATTYYRLPTPYVTYDAYMRFTAWQLADLALFRHVPHAAKPWVYNAQAWRLQTWFGSSADTPGRRYLPVNGQAFMADFTDKMRVAHDSPTYKYLHVGIPHWPVSVDAECAYIGARSLRRPNYTDQARCGVRRLGAFLDKLRELGLYDSSLVLISSDHGVALSPEGFTGERDVFGARLSELAGSAMALLVVKPPQATGPLKVTQAPSAISDIPATIVDTLGLNNPFPGVSALKLDEEADRPRQFATYLWSSAGWHTDFFSYLDIFTVRGRAVEGDAWTLEEPVYAPNADTEARSRGFYRPEPGPLGQTIRWSTPRAYFHPPSDARGIELSVRSDADGPQTLTVEIGGKPIDTQVLRDHEWHTLSYPVPRSDGTGARSEWIVLQVDPPWRRGRGRRTYGVMTRGVKWLD